ncbi:hypothetical protein D3C75_1245500 [compost metagenome]
MNLHFFRPVHRQQPAAPVRRKHYRPFLLKPEFILRPALRITHGKRGVAAKLRDKEIQAARCKAKLPSVYSGQLPAPQPFQLPGRAGQLQRQRI